MTKKRDQSESSRKHRSKKMLEDPKAWAAYKRLYYTKNRERLLRKFSDDRIRKLYGLSLEELDAIIDGQGGGCGICKKTVVRGPKMHIDHDHDTGAVRGVLCRECNMALGKFGDGETLLLAAVAYLRRGQT